MSVLARCSRRVGTSRVRYSQNLTNNRKSSASDRGQGTGHNRPSNYFEMEQIASAYVMARSGSREETEMAIRQDDSPVYHERQAAHLRELAAAATTAKMKMHLLTRAEEHERVAAGNPEEPTH